MSDHGNEFANYGEPELSPSGWTNSIVNAVYEIYKDPNNRQYPETSLDVIRGLAFDLEVGGIQDLTPEQVNQARVVLFKEYPVTEDSTQNLADILIDMLHHLPVDYTAFGRIDHQEADNAGTDTNRLDQLVRSINNQPEIEPAESRFELLNYWLEFLTQIEDHNLSGDERNKLEKLQFAFIFEGLILSRNQTGVDQDELQAKSDLAKELLGGTSEDELIWYDRSPLDENVIGYLENSPEEKLFNYFDFWQEMYARLESERRSLIGNDSDNQRSILETQAGAAYSILEAIRQHAGVSRTFDMPRVKPQPEKAEMRAISELVNQRVERDPNSVQTNLQIPEKFLEAIIQLDPRDVDRLMSDNPRNSLSTESKAAISLLKGALKENVTAENQVLVLELTRDTLYGLITQENLTEPQKRFLFKYWEECEVMPFIADQIKEELNSESEESDNK